MQELLQITIERLFEYLQISSYEVKKYILVCKYGFDRTTEFESYKQDKVNDPSGSIDSRENILGSFFVPLILKQMITGKIVWKNPLPSSARFCRQIRLFHGKETQDVCKNEEARLAFDVGWNFSVLSWFFFKFFCYASLME